MEQAEDPADGVPVADRLELGEGNRFSLIVSCALALLPLAL